MSVRLWEDTDYDALTATGGYAANYAKNVTRWLEKGWLQRNGCFVFEGAGGVCFAEDGGDLEILDFAVNDGRIEEGAALLKAALGQGAANHKVTYNLYDDTPQFGAIREAFEECGFNVRQEKLCYVHTVDCFAPLAMTAGVEFRSYDDVGEDAFVEAVRRVTVGTLDTGMARDAHERGGEVAAREYVDGLKGLDFRADWWRLAYVGGELAGLIIPQAFNAEVGAINYIGVTPEKRGAGLGAALLAEGTRTLCEFGLKKIYADIDKGNWPLKRQLEQVGYNLKCEEAVLERQ